MENWGIPMSKALQRSNPKETRGLELFFSVIEIKVEFGDIVKKERVKEMVLMEDDQTRLEVPTTMALVLVVFNWSKL
ncbi:hypothetical protein ILYODFUR_034552 [Ilyodon furcidens]|uniref:Uncharacterized protein n=1 Tax=Ilyodon furcidens TaxID=33524 RepID=A0ABV0SSN4_9TELE